MKFDQILEYLGEFGRYQKILYFMVCLSTIPCAFHSLGNTFLSASPDHQCSYYTGQKFTSEDEQARCLYPQEAKKTSRWSECEKFANLSISGPGDYNCTDEDISGYETISCDKGWTYSTEFYYSTVVTEWDLVCERNWMKQLSKSIVLVGKLVGSLFFGQLSDITGRRIGLLLSILFMVLGSIGTTFSPTFWFYCVMQFFVGMTASGVFIVAFVIGTELVGSSWRAFTGIAIEYFYSIGYMLLAAISNGLRDWRQTEMVFVACVLVFFSYYWLLPESPRWLLAKGRSDEAEKIIRRAASVNKVTLPPELFKKEIQETDEKHTTNNSAKTYSFVDLFRTPVLRKRTFNLFFNWFTNSMLYYGLSFQTESLGRSPYLSFFYAGLVEIPSYMFAQLVVDRIGRKALLCGYMITGALVLFGTIPIPEEGYDTLLLVLVLFGKFCVSGSFAVVYLFTAEMYPTPIRNVGVGSCSMASRIGGILAPYVLLIGEVTSIAVPMTLFGIMSLIAGLLILILPETKGCKLPETVEEAENFTGSKNNQLVSSTVQGKRRNNEEKAESTTF